MMDRDGIRERTYRAKRKVLDMALNAGMGHVSSAYSCAEILATLYYGVMRFDPKNPSRDDRDRLIMSKNHGSLMQYPILADLGCFPEDELRSFLSADGTRLGTHAKTDIAGVDFSGGSLGIGLSVASGLAYGAKIDGKDYVTFALIGDGECYEGGIWEAAMFAAHNKLSRLIAVLDRNGLAVTDRTENMLALEPLTDKWRAFGWEVRTCDGHDIGELLAAFSDVRTRADERPLIVIARTRKGKGLEFMEDRLFWHGVAPKPRDAEKAYASLEREATER